MANKVAIGPNGIEIVSTSATTSSFDLGNVHKRSHFEYHSHGPATQHITGSGFRALAIDGTDNVLNGGLSNATYTSVNNLWNTTTNTFTPVEMDKAYAITVKGVARVSDPGANPSLIIATAMTSSVINPTAHTSWNRHHNEQSMPIRSGSVVGTPGAGGQALDPQWSSTFHLFADADLLVTGVQIYASIEAVGAGSTNPITGTVDIVSCSITIVELF